MTQIPEKLYKQIVKISKEVKQDLRIKGIVIPVDNANGTISFGHYTMLKTQDGFYSILDFQGDTVVSQINLPQTAIMTANDLALGKFLDNNTISRDQHYGYAMFEEALYTRMLANSNNKSLEYFEVMLTKKTAAKVKKDTVKSEIVRRFEKLRTANK